MALRTSILLGAALLSGCQTLPPAYAPPVQRPLFANSTPYRVHKVIAMSDGDADAHIVGGILFGDGQWRWTSKRPEVRVFLGTNRMLSYTIDFSIVQATFKDTGPVELSFYVNGHLLDRVRFSSPGEKHFEMPVPEDWMEPGKDTIVSAEIDKVWVSPADHQTLGFTLTRMGLVQE